MALEGHELDRVKPWIISSSKRTNPGERSENFYIATGPAMDRAVRSFSVTSLYLSHHIRNITAAKRNNSTDITMTAGSGTFSFDDGNYSLTDVITQLNSDVSLLLSVSGFATYDATTDRVTLDDGTTNALTLTNINFWKMLGFDEDQLSGGVSPLVGSRPPSLVPTKYIHLQMEDTSRTISIGSTPLQSSIASVLLNVHYGEVLMMRFENPIELSHYRKISNPRFILRDDNGDVIDNQNMDWGFTMELVFL